MMARSAIRLIVRQQPLRAQVVQENNPKNRKPIDPPPIIELKYDNEREEPQNSQWLVSPRTFMMVTLIDGKEGDEQVPGKYLIGQTVSSLHRLKDINNKDAGFFVFGDISARKIGIFRLRFSLFDTIKETEEVIFMGHIDSDPFPVMVQRDFGSMSESTALTRAFSEQGVKLRVRKDTRAISSGTKRAYNASPTSSSPHLHTGIYGGAVQDHYGAATPGVKRQRTGSDYSQQNVYHNMSMVENTMPQYSANTIPSSTRHWGGDEQQQTRVQNQFNQLSPLSLPNMNNRVQSMNMQGANSWQSMHAQNALPSPSPSVSNPQASYSSVSSQHSSSMFGDPGSANNIPRHYYSSSYQQYPTHQQPGQYAGHTAADVQNAYPDLQIPVTSLPDTSGLVSAQNHGYNHGYLQSSAAGNIFGSEANELSGGYAFFGDAQQ